MTARAPRVRRSLARALSGLRDRRGATIVEFAIIAPVMMMVIMALGDLSYQEYVQSILTGAVQKAGRDSGIQGGADQTAAIDGTVVTMVSTVIQNMAQNCGTAATAATWCSTRKNYDAFTEVAPEPFTDTNKDGICNNGESYTDKNGNSQWDADPGLAGQGGANDVTLYTMTITYPRLFPVAGLLGFAGRVTLSSSTLLKNQPYATQTVAVDVTLKCT